MVTEQTPTTPEMSEEDVLSQMEDRELQRLREESGESTPEADPVEETPTPEPEPEPDAHQAPEPPSEPEAPKLETPDERTLRERAVQSEIDRNIALMNQGKFNEMDPKIRSLIDRGRQESNEETRARQDYEQILALRRSAMDGDPDAQTAWNAKEQEYDQYISDYKAWEKNKQAVASQTTAEQVKQQAREEAAQELIATQIRSFLGSLTEYSKLSDVEKREVYDKKLSEAKGDLGTLYTKLTDWEIDQRFQKRGGERVADRAAEAVQRNAQAQRLAGTPEPDTSSGDAGTGLNNLDDWESAVAAGTVTVTEFGRWIRDNHIDYG